MTQPSWIGHTLGGRYKIEAELGHGGMATVYKAADPNLRRVVAIKLIHAHISRHPEFIRRFEAEATVVARLRHSNIIQVHDFSHDSETYYIVFEFIQGGTLQDKLKRLNESGRQMEMAELLHIATSVGDALGYAHTRDIIHRDVKPANVLLNEQGEAILTDFGIVKIVGGTQHTVTGAVMGTARYMSPEQINGRKVDLRSDIYSYGVMLYEVVSGQPPFNADSAVTLMMKHVNEPVPDVRQLRSEVSPQLAAIINKAMAKEPDQRYQTMAELLRDLQRVQASTATVAGVASAGKTVLDADLTDLLEPESTNIDPGSYFAQPPVPADSSQSPANMEATPKQNRTMLWGIGLLALAAVIVIGFFVFRPSRDLGDGVAAATPESTAVSEAITTVAATAVPEIIPTENTATATATDIPPTATTALAPTATATATAPLPTATSPAPTATNPPPTQITQLSAQITGISLEGDRYSVSYTTVGYTESLPGQHVHFFFNTVPQDQAGLPGSGPWIVYGGPRPFTGYGPADRPGSATQMCILVANSDHSIIANSGNCVNLP